jgi:hypothetical protein
MSQRSNDVAARTHEEVLQESVVSMEIVPYKQDEVKVAKQKKSTHNAFRECKKRLRQGEALYPMRQLPVLVDDEPADYEEALQRGVKPKRYSTCQKIGLGEEGKPCPFVSCKAHLALEVRGSSLVVCAPHLIPPNGADDPVIDILFEDMEQTCANRLFEEPHTLEAIGNHLGLTRERVRQIESNGMKALRRYLGDKELSLLQSRIAKSRAPTIQELLGSVWVRKTEKSSSMQRNHVYIVQSVREETIVDLVCMSGAVKTVSLSKDNLIHKYDMLHDGASIQAAYAMQYWLVGA